MGSIYKITNIINGKCYIGQSQAVNKRLSDHKYNSTSKDKFNDIPKLYNAIRKYGKNNFKFEIISNDIDNWQLDFWERFYICLYNSVYNGYNIAFGGNTTLGLHHTTETKNKISNSLLGNIVPEYVKKKISEKMIMYNYIFLSPEHIQYFTNNLEKLCKEFNLDPGCMNKVCNGKRRHHKGWTCIKKELIPDK